MHLTRDIRKTVFENGSAVLMARIVDRDGVCIRRDQVASIGYSMDELRPHDAPRRKQALKSNYTRLNVDEVFFDSLECGRLWTVDVAGYNFRHEIHASPDGAFPKLGRLYEIRYAFIPKIGAATIIRFHVRIVSR